MKLKMGALAGQKLFNHKDGQRDRDKAIDDLNTRNLSGIVMTDRVGGCGHNLVGASHMIFIGSLYSQAYEDQCVGNWIVMMTINGSSHLQTWTDSDSSRMDHCGPKLCYFAHFFQLCHIQHLSEVTPHFWEVVEINSFVVYILRGESFHIGIVNSASSLLGLSYPISEIGRWMYLAFTMIESH